MALNFRNSTKFIPVWNGNDKDDDPITVDIVRLRVKDLFGVQKKMMENERISKATDEQQNIDMADPILIMELWDIIEETVANFTENWSGITANGKPVTTGRAVMDEISQEENELASEVFAKILSISQVDDESEKKSEPDSDQQNLESGLIAEAA